MKKGPANKTDTSFTSKKVVIRAQNIKSSDGPISADESSALTMKIKSILPNCGHYNGNMRKDSTLNVLKCLKEFDDLNSASVLSCLDPIFVATFRQICDEEVAVRTSFLGLMTFLFDLIKTENMASFFPRWISFLNLASSHIKPEIRRDSIRFISMTLKSQKQLFLPYIHTILPTIIPLLTQYPARQGAVPAYDCAMNLIFAYLEPFKTGKEAEERNKPLISCIWTANDINSNSKNNQIQLVRSSPTCQGPFASNFKPQPISETSLQLIISHLSNLSISIWLDNFHLLKTKAQSSELKEILSLYNNLYMLTRVSNFDEELFWRSMPVKIVKTSKTQLESYFKENELK